MKGLVKCSHLLLRAQGPGPPVLCIQRTLTVEAHVVPPLVHHRGLTSGPSQAWRELCPSVQGKRLPSNHSLDL